LIRPLSGGVKFRLTTDAKFNKVVQYSNGKATNLFTQLQSFLRTRSLVPSLSLHFITDFIVYLTTYPMMILLLGPEEEQEGDKRDV